MHWTVLPWFPKSKVWPVNSVQCGGGVYSNSMILSAFKACIAVMYVRTGVGGGGLMISP